MNASMFSSKLRELAPTVNDFIMGGLSENGANEFIREWHLLKTGNRNDIEDPILDLVINYDTVDIGVGTITIDDHIETIGNFLFFGNFEGDFLAIDKTDNKIKVISYTSRKIIYECADDSSRFLDSMIPVAKLRSMKYKNQNITEKMKTEYAKMASENAGGEKYLSFFYRLIGIL